jgi:hypothetical protein
MSNLEYRIGTITGENALFDPWGIMDEHDAFESHDEACEDFARKHPTWTQQNEFGDDHESALFTSPDNEAGECESVEFRVEWRSSGE